MSILPSMTRLKSVAVVAYCQASWQLSKTAKNGSHHRSQCCWKLAKHGNASGLDVRRYPVSNDNAVAQTL